MPEMSQSFSSCIARAVLVMSMDETDRSSLSAKSAASGLITATSESERPEKKKSRGQSREYTIGIQKEHPQKMIWREHPRKMMNMWTNRGPWLSGWVEVEGLPEGWPAPGPTDLHFGLKEPSKVPENQTQLCRQYKMFHSKLSLLNIAVNRIWGKNIVWPLAYPLWHILMRLQDNILQGLQDQLYVFVESFWW